MTDTPTPSRGGLAATETSHRAIEMLRIAATMIRDNCSDAYADYDGTTCDGGCVADDCEAVAERMEEGRARRAPSAPVEVAGLVERAHETLPGIETPAMMGDNLAVFLCGYLDNPHQEPDELTGWTPDGVAGYEQIIAAIRAHYDAAFTAASAAKDAEIARVTAENERLLENTNRFPELMASIRAAKAQGLPERIADLADAIEGLPDDFGRYQWQADTKALFGDKFVRTVAGNKGFGIGQQWIATTPPHIAGLANYIAAANPDTIGALIVDYAATQARAERAEAALAESEAKLKAARDAQIARGDVVADTNPEARWIADSENNCPACGGSGHKDDATEALAAYVKQAVEAETRACAEVCARQAPEPAGGPYSHTNSMRVTAFDCRAAILARLDQPAGEA